MTDTGGDTRKIDILLVDDRLENLIALEAVLANPRYNLIKADSGEAALRYLLGHDPAIILMDVQMPGLDGFETASLLKKNERTREIPIIFITAINKDERYVHKGYDHGAVDYIYKPFDAHILRSKVAVFAELHSKTQRLVELERQQRHSERREREQRITQLELKNLRRERADQKRYRDLVEGIDHGIVWSADANNLAVTFVSPSAARILGHSLALWTLERDFITKHVHADDYELLLSSIARLRETRGDVGFDHRFIKADGTVAWLRTGMRFANKADGNGYEIRALSVDITKTKQTEEAMRRSKQRSDFAAEASLLISETLDQATILTRIGSLAVPRLADLYLAHIIDDAGNMKLEASAHALLSEETLGKILKVPFMTPGTTKQPALFKDLIENDVEIAALGLKSMLVVPLKARGRVIGAMTLASVASNPPYDELDLALATDLARRAATAVDNASLYRQAQTAIRARDEFLSIASHELKTPLTPLKIQTQGLLRTLKAGSLSDVSPERVAKMVQSSDRQLGRLSRLIEDLLDISRINIGRLNLNLEPFDLVDVAKDVLERFAEQLASARCTAKLKSKAPLMGTWDRFRIEQVIINLLANAIKYGPGQPIEMELTQSGEWVDITVRDRGIGIAKEDQQRIFNRFERAVSGNHYGGLGLGLYIVHQIIAAHGGSITVESEPGQGSSFHVRLPLHTVQVTVSADSSAGVA